MRRAAAMLAALSLAAGPAVAQTPYVAVAPLAPGVSDCPGGLCQADALSRFFDALNATETGARAEPVRILQLGDSHTAGDGITGTLRSRLQTRFGAAGRGVAPPGVPYDGYRPFQMQAAAEGWTSAGGLAPRDGSPGPLLGLGGFAATASAGAVMTYALEPAAAARRVGVCGRALPGGGVRLTWGGAVQDLIVGAEGAPETCVAAARADAVEAFSLSPLGDGVMLDSVASETGRAGVMVSNLGVVGAALKDLASRDEGMVRTQLEAWSPDLIVLAYGTNEGFDDALDAAAYEALLRAQVQRLRALAPGADLLILGAPDALRSGQGGGCSADGRRAPPPNLAVVRNVQRRVAADMAVAFWDWRGRMGGDCSADRLALRDEPFVFPDRVHFTGRGAEWIGGVLADDLMAAYEARRARAR